VFVLPIATGYSPGGRCLLAVIFEDDWGSQAPSEENETRRPSDHHSKQKALQQRHSKPPFYGNGPPTKPKHELGQDKFPVNPQIHTII
jgi:hypothetical protein